MDDFLGNHVIVNDISSRNKSNLLLSDNFKEDEFEAVGYYLHHQFIEDSAKDDGSKLREALEILDLGNEDDQSVIELSINSTPIKDLLNPVTNVRFHDIPVFLEEKSLKIIIPRALNGAILKRAILISSSVTGPPKK